MEPSVAELPDGSLLMSLRSQLGTVLGSRSRDGGDTWSEAFSLGLRSPESGNRLRAAPGGLLLVWIDAPFDPSVPYFGKRTPLSLARSLDGGATWVKLGDVDTGQFAFNNFDCLTTTSGSTLITYNRIHARGSDVVCARYDDLR